MSRRKRTVIGLVVLAVVALGASAMAARHYFLAAPLRQEAAAPPASPFGQFTAIDPPRPAPALSFAARDGAPHALADFRGRWVLVNLWATWCAPCVREMPALDRLQAKLGERLTVLALSEDRRGAEVVDPFLETLHLGALVPYLDPKAAATAALGARGLPTSYLIDGEGRILAQLEGEAKWDSPAMLATLDRYLAGSAAAK